jgi:SAM-dependent methyltransferase
MRPDVIDLQTFYGSAQGLLVRRLLIRQIRQLWPDLSGCRVLGLGYAVPFLAPISEGAERVIAIMPEAQGAIAWPPERPNQVALAADHDLPLADRSIDRALIVHALESAEPLRPMLREVWRVLADGGQALILVPNRRGLWCLFEGTPFGYGKPYSSAQLKEALRNHLFTPRRTGRALFMPPLRSRLWMRTAIAWERIGLRWARHFSGVVLMVAEKQIYAAPMEMAPARQGARAYIPVPGRLAAAERVRDESDLEDDARRDRRG